MSYSSDEILSFATQIAYVLRQPWGESWTTREVDGCFYYQFHNDKLYGALENIRHRHFGQKAPPWPGRYDSRDLPPIVIRASLGIPPVRSLPELWEIDYAAEQFQVDVRYLRVAYLTGMPVPFCRYVAKMHTDQNHAPVIKLDIFSRRVSNNDWILIERIYQRYLAQLEKEELKTWVDHAQSEPSRLQDLRGRLVEEGVPHIEILSYPPFASNSSFVRAVKEYFDKEKDRLTGRGTPEVAIRAWTGYLLTTLIEKSNRQAIMLINEVLGEQCGTYAMNQVLRDTWGHSGGVTSSGEIQFSNDRTQLIERIHNYDSWLAQADPSWSLIK